MFKYLGVEPKSGAIMEKAPFSCTNCNSENVVFAKNREIVVQVGNPKVVRFKADCYECKDCGETYLDEKEMEKSAKAIDTQLKK